MGFENKLARFSRNTGPARMLVPIGVILIVFGIVMLSFHFGDLIKTTGKITAVTEAGYEDDVLQYNVDFTYTVDDKEYNSSFSDLPGTFAVGDAIEVYYDSENPEKTANSKLGGILAPIFLVAGAAAVGFGVYQTVKAFKKSKKLDETATATGAPANANFEGFKTAPGVTEYYFRFDGHSLKPGYLIEDAERNVLFEGKMVKNSLVGARLFHFIDHTTGSEVEHEVGHTATTSFSDEAFSATSWFKFDGKNVWDVLHERGLRINTNVLSHFPKLIYEVSQNGAAFVRIETSSIYVHEEDEAQHKLVVPYGKMYYRFWTASKDFDTLFLTMFAITETEQTVVE